MLPPLIVMSVLICFGWLVIPKSWQGGHGSQGRDDARDRARERRGTLAVLFSVTAFTAGGWALYATDFASGEVAAVEGDAGALLIAVGIVLVILRMFVFTFRRSRAAARSSARAESLARQRETSYSPARGPLGGGAGVGPFASEELELLPGEVLFARLSANGVQGGRAFGGRLHITSRRLVFVPVSASQTRGGSRSDIPLDEVAAADVAPMGRGESSATMLRRELRVTMRSGDLRYFVVWQPRKAAHLIEQARLGMSPS